MTPPELSLPAHLSVTMLSDWHIGTGAGVPGGVDRAVVRDIDGLPYIPASSLTGVVRAAAGTVARALDNGGRHGPWQEWHRWLFGGLSDRGELSPSTAAVSITAARFPDDVRAALIGEGLVTDTTIVRYSTAIDPDTGTAADKTLRMIELARKGSVLLASVEPSDAGHDLPPEAAFLLAAAAQMCERLGAKRTRGWGRCQMTFDPKPNWEAWCKWAGEHTPSAVSSPAAVATDHPVAHQQESGAGWETLGLELVAVEPVAIESERRGNTLTTDLRIPGTMLLAHISKHLGQGLGASIARGDLRVSDALPLAADGRRSTPTPAGWLVPKQTTDGPSTLTDTLLDHPPPGGQLRRVADPYVVVDHGHVAHGVQVETLTDAHAVIDEDTGRPTAASGGLFLRSAIRPGTRFGMSVRWRRGLLDRDAVRSALEGRWRIGTARHAGYGAVKVHAMPGSEPIPRDVVVASAGDLVMAEAHSDVLLRDDRLRWDPTPAALARTLSVDGWVFEPAESGPGADTAAISVSRRDSWHAGWALPRPTLGAIGAGSRVLLSCVATGPPETLAELVDRGVGERLGEGFGDVRIRAVEPDANTLDPALPPAAPAHPEPSTTSDDPFVVSVRRAQVRREVQLSLHEAQLPGVTNESPGSSQLGALRSVGATLALGASPADLERTKAWVNGLTNTARRVDKWDQSTLQHIRGLLDDPDNVWRELRLPAHSELTNETLGWYLAAAARNGGPV